MFFETKNLCFSYYKSPLCLKDVNFSCDKNSKTVILSTKEMGKTTFLKVLSGFEDSRFGNIYIEGKEFKDIEDSTKKTSLILSNPILLQRKTIKENLDYQCEVNEIEKLEPVKIEKFLKEYKIEKSIDAKVKKLSLLEKRKLQIIRAIIKNPSIIFLDNQFEGLKDEEIEDMIQVYKKLLNDKNLTVVFAVDDVVYKILKAEFEKVKTNVYYLFMANLSKFDSFEKFEKSFETLDILNFLEVCPTQDVYIERDVSSYYLCAGEERIFKFDSKFNKKLNLLKLEFGEIEDCEILILSGKTVKEIDSFEFNKGISEKLIFVYSKLTRNLVI